MRIVPVMAPDERDETADEPTSGASKAAAGETAPIPEPSPEEVPELLGECSDYPIPFGEDEEGAAREGRVDDRADVPPLGGTDAERPPA